MSENTAAGTSATGAGSPVLPPTNREQTPGSSKKSAGLRLGGGSGVARNLGLVIALALLCVVGVVTAGERFLSTSNITTILALAATIGILSVGMTFVITGGGIDLSVGSVLGLATVWATTLATQTMAGDIHWIVMALAALVVGTAAGLVNGIIVAYGRVVPFIATLAMLVAARGLAEIISDRRTLLIPASSLEGERRSTVDGFMDFFGGDFLGLPVTVWMFIVIAALGWVLLNRTTFGRRTVAVGGNPEAARLAGIKVQRHTMYLFALAGLAAGIAAITMLARTGAGTSTHGYLYELDAIAAVVVGGTLLIGGRGTIVGTVFGVLIFATLRNVFILNNLSTSVQAVAQGTIIVLAVLLQQRIAARGSK
ncbi:monosaccharide ABC transporter membrane protein, CUT2 family [Georgenia satyanarayanai]|uniref:Monosaccharide ABC transporter membrane protein, CUT2 family n=1 Tax=Georgenia satyanarayanai TaxID=860221 RepID=A0A2Y9AGA8_9MICO|nr:ABC transporter permease [Georgenia satyanarayanai]PYF99423.1 monosaccharide ABC transporter membrane protein (CUT2 family) [Georgenia satyanarayanai]SSA43235.1 monosaccharide ABC transporter membrane protein, CUT2 family [Georgenia satyanarayanai]